MRKNWFDLRITEDKAEAVVPCISCYHPTTLTFKIPRKLKLGKFSTKLDKALATRAAEKYLKTAGFIVCSKCVCFSDSP